MTVRRDTPRLKNLTRALAALVVLLFLGSVNAIAEDGFQELRLPSLDSETVEVELELDGRARTLQLRRHSLRSYDFALLEDRGGELVSVEVSEPQTYIGEIIGVAGSRAGAILSEDGMRAFIHDPKDGIWVVTPESGSLHRSYRLDSKTPSAGICGVGEMSPLPPGAFDRHTPEDDRPESPPRTEPLDEGALLAIPGRKSAEIAIDADYELYEHHGFSTWAVLQDLETILMGVNVIYESQFELTHTLSAVIVRTAEEDPYSFTDAQWLLEQMADYWNETHSDVRADMVHLMTGRQIWDDTIGLAYVGAACNPWYRYGLSETTYDTDLGLRTALTAHELGHNWSAQHCDGEADCGIMCSAIGSCTEVVDVFGTSAVDSISTFVDLADCLEPAFPQVVYVDGSYTGASSGTFGRPFTSVSNGVSGLVSDGLLVIRSGTYVESLLFRRPMLLRTYLGSSIISP